VYAWWKASWGIAVPIVVIILLHSVFSIPLIIHRSHCTLNRTHLGGCNTDTMELHPVYSTFWLHDRTIVRTRWHLLFVSGLRRLGSHRGKQILMVADRHNYWCFRHPHEYLLLYTLYFANQRQHITDMKTILQTLTRSTT